MKNYYFVILLISTMFFTACDNDPGQIVVVQSAAAPTVQDVTPPTILSTSPQEGARLVDINSNIAITFSEEMDPSTINASNVTLKNALGVMVPGTIVYNSTVATFSPLVRLSYSSHYNLEVSTAVQDIAGNMLVEKFSVTFNTGPLARACYLFDENQGSTTEDCSGNGNTGVLHNATWIPGHSGSALRFNGTSGSFVQVLHSDSLNITGPLTITAWVNWDGDWTANDYVLRKYDAVQGGYKLWATNHRLTFGIDGIGTESATLYPVGNWGHIAVSWNGTEAKFYKNGLLDSTTSLVNDLSANNLSLFLGDEFSGSLDEIRIYSEELSSEDICAISGLVTCL